MSTSLTVAGGKDTVSAKSPVNELLNRAKDCIASGESSLREAAEFVAQAMTADKKLTQREVAEYVGKSQPWINGLIRWKMEGYKDATPFGPQSAKARAERDKAPNKSKPKPKPTAPREKLLTREQASAHDAKASDARRSAPGITEQQSHDWQALAKLSEEEFERVIDRAKAADAISGEDRRRLVELLGMLGSDQAGERDAAAVKVEDHRRQMGLTWNELIIEAV